MTSSTQYSVYYSKPVTQQLQKLTLNAEQPYQVEDYSDYKKFVENQLGLPLKTVLIRVK